MVVYTYDGSFEGLLTAIYESYYRKVRPCEIRCADNLQINLLNDYQHIPVDQEKSEKVYRSIRDKISVHALEMVYHVFLSEVPEAGNMILDYLRLGWKLGRAVDSCLADDRVLKVHQLSRRVTNEAHLMSGFVRFRLLEGGIFYAPIKPDYNILELLAPHFVDRFSDQNWVIHDVGRKLAAVYNRSEWVLMDADVEEQFGVGAEEMQYQELWKEFFNSIAIKSRINPKLQKRLMPVRYWRYMTEKW